MSVLDLTGRVILVTGGSTGIGLAIADAVLQAGGQVCVCARGERRLAAVAERRPDAADRILAVPCDVTVEAAVASCVRQCIDRFGRLDGCVANAGIDGVAPLHEMSLQEWRRVITGNLDSAFLVCREAIRVMLEHDIRGSLVTVGSVAALRGRPGRAHYVAAKAALVGLTRSIAVEYGARGIRANAVMPGPVDTEMSLQAPDHESLSRRAAQQVPVGRRGTPGEIAAVVIYLLSELSQYHTGDVICVDGGLSAVLADRLMLLAGRCRR